MRTRIVFGTIVIVALLAGGTGVQAQEPSGPPIVIEESLIAPDVASSSSSATDDESWRTAKTIASLASAAAGYFSDAKSASAVASVVFAALGWTDTSSDAARFDALEASISTVATDVSWEQVRLFLDGYLADAKWAYDTAQGKMARCKAKAPAGLTPLAALSWCKAHPELDVALLSGGNEDQSSGPAVNAVLDSMDGTASVEKGAFFRPYSDKEAAGMKYFGYPKSDLIPRSSGLIYDWRLGIPAALQLISYRLYVIAAIQPNFRTDPQYVKELTQYRDALQRHYDLMLSGVRCSARSGGSLSDFPIRCADIRSDYSVSAFRLSPYRVAYRYFSRFWDLTTLIYYSENSSTPGSNVAGQGSDAEILSFERAQVGNTMPLFEVKAMIDTLYLYTHPTSDLTEVSNRITPMASPTLCLDVTGFLRGPIYYGREAQLVRCDGSASQRWIYDRRAGTVKTPPTGTTTEQCLGLIDWADATRVSGDAFYVGTADCVAAYRSQRWTYDSERKTLLNAWSGTVLDIKWNNLNPGAEVWSWPVNYTPAQLWRADQRTRFPPPPFF